MRLDLHDRLQAEFFLTGVWEPALVRQIVRLLPPGGTFFDVGANVGLASLSVALRTKGKGIQIHAFEPSPENAAAFRRNLDLNPDAASRVKLVQAAAGSAAGELPLTLGMESGHHFLTPAPTGGAVTVPVISLGDYARDNGISQIDCMKVDVEGWELEVFRGIEDLVSEHAVRALVCEVEQCHLQRAGSSAKDVVGFLLTRGYVPVVLRKFSDQIRSAFAPTPTASNLRGDVLFLRVEDVTER